MIFLVAVRVVARSVGARAAVVLAMVVLPTVFALSCGTTEQPADASAKGGTSKTFVGLVADHSTDRAAEQSAGSGIALGMRSVGILIGAAVK